jgi:hypothetical protein
MACRGVHFAVEADTVKLLLDAKSDSAVLDIVQEDIEQKWNEEWLHQTDKSWDAATVNPTGTTNLPARRPGCAPTRRGFRSPRGEAWPDVES